MEKKDSLQECTFLVNPTRHPSSAKVLEKLIKRKTSASIITTSSKDNLQEEVKKFCNSSHKFLVIWGGDGTVHQAINTMMTESPKGKALGFLRGGTGNGIQDSYEIPKRLSKQLEVYTDSVRNSFIEPVDIMRIEIGGKTIYGQLLGIGFDTEVLKVRRDNYYLEDKDIVKPGVRYYILTALKIFRRFEFSSIPERTLIFSDGKFALKGNMINAEYPFVNLERKTKAPLIEIGTRPYYAKQFRICPDVVCNDGNMDAYLYQFTSHWRTIINFPALWKGWHNRINGRLVQNQEPLIERYEVKEVEIIMEPETDLHIDGELYNTGTAATIRISIIPRALTFLVPGSFYHKFHPFETMGNQEKA